MLETDGHDMGDILRTLRHTREENDSHRPTYVIANTVKGKGVSFMENDYTWHTKKLSPDEYATALADLGVGTDTVGQGVR